MQGGAACQDDLPNAPPPVPPAPTASANEAEGELPPTAILLGERLGAGVDEPERLDVWGFADSAFYWDAQGVVRMGGNRYAHCGQPLPALAPWVARTMQIALGPEDVVEPHYPPALPAPVLPAAFVAALAEFLPPAQRSHEARLRLRHGHGHTQSEMYAIKYGKPGRVPDLVVYPDSEGDLLRLVQAAKDHNVCLIPYGGGTNVSEALRCREDEPRSIVSVDMQRMCRLKWIDPVNRLACVEAGAVGRHLQAALRRHGFMLGHEPDSLEFSTLGGWVATHASGMKKNRYGNIEDLVLDMRVVTADGLLSRGKGGLAPREAVGFDPRLALFGSEGSLGIVSSAVIKLFALPQAQRYGSVLFPNFERGVAFLYALQQSGLKPASVRLVDNLQFQFGIALNPASVGFKKILSAAQKFYVTRIKKFDPEQMVALTLVYEGSAAQVAAEQAHVGRLAKQFAGLEAGAENGRRGYELTYSIAYIRDFVMRHQVIAESMETSVPWSQAKSLCERVKARMRREHRARNLPGEPFLTCRISQLYDTGVCVYFYFGFYAKGVCEPSRVYAEIEHAAREEILAAGGSLSHHHGVGKLRQPFYDQIMSATALQWGQRAKEAFDPQNLFASGNYPAKRAP